MKKVVAALLMMSMVLSLAACGSKENKSNTSATNAADTTKATAAAGATTEKVKTLKDGVLQVGMEVGYPPFEYFDADGKTILGFDAQLAKAIGEKLGLKVEFVDTAWDGIFAGLNTKKYDCIMSAVTVTDERKAKFLFSNPYIGNAQALVLSKDSKVTATKLEELTDLKVGYQAETTSDEVLTKMADNGLKFTAKEYEKVLNCFDDLKLKRIDAVVCDKTVALDYVNKDSNTYKLVWSGETTETFGVCMQKDNTALKTAIDKALAELFSDGKLTEISKGIFKDDLSVAVKDLKN
jgi:polar amino acid transport system substrate-binding protein